MVDSEQFADVDKSFADNAGLVAFFPEGLDFRVDITEVIDKISPSTQMIILNSPNNPTGSVLKAEDLEMLAQACRGHKLMILSDEVYNRMIYEGEHTSITSYPGMKEKTILLDGFSKTYAMTGWRLGYGVMRPDLAAQIGKLMINSNSCTAAFTQVAGIHAIQGPQDKSEEIDKFIHVFASDYDNNFLNQQVAIDNWERMKNPKKIRAVAFWEKRIIDPLLIMEGVKNENLEGLELSIDFHPFNYTKLLPEEFKT